VRSVLVSGGTGSFGRAFVRRLLEDREIERVVVFSRDELNQHQMRCDGFTDPRLRFFVGDVRDRDRLRRACQGVDTVVHAAALKQVDTIEYNPLEAVKTNIGGTSNVIDAALDCGVSRVLMLGTDKAVDPTNLYGATKLVAEKLVVDANAYSGADGPVFAATRYGNVISSRGSVLPVFQAQAAAGEILSITNPHMTRFVLTLEQGVDFVVRALGEMRGGEVFVPKLPAVTVRTIADAVIYPRAMDPVHRLGLRPGEKMHELLVSEHEAARTLDVGWAFLVRPVADLGRSWGGVPVPAGFRFSSESAVRLDVEGFRCLAGLDSNLEVVA
jgi:UDP-N-acetylglucosamine 4,6-dehydratase/5-epimerase